jgi:hypothetical protein
MKNRYKITIKHTIMKYLLFILTIILFTSCGHFHDDPKTSVWAEGLFLVPWLLGIGAAACLVISILKSKSGSTKQTTGGIEQSTINVPFYKTGQFKWAVGLTIVLIIVLLFVNSGWNK